MSQPANTRQRAIAGIAALLAFAGSAVATSLHAGIVGQSENARPAPHRKASPFPPRGRTAVVDFDGPKFRLHFVDDKTMWFEDVSGAFKGVRDTVHYTAVEVSRNVFMVYWHEPSTGSNVVHVQNWNTGIVWTNIAAKDGSFLHFKGTIRLQ